ncbi:hypothetical protein JCM19301_1920 [Jejuia pallidilutea]|uniref:Uncharacterized protein n=1 Tax=Jejuia pallidilutea TaxID=504487 RepID=A0A090WM60_9FLAO|nr:hypothetical protein JCM19301_1920 [Jejuia pallidilutea]GAL72087.1 hypothetical protein JCM19302_2214 [Jejuia pallidilutea]GAL88402.1 hypothetical protein JCM19538_2915 [Jejuia pallidilutea]
MTVSMVFLNFETNLIILQKNSRCALNSSTKSTLKTQTVQY